MTSRPQRRALSAAVFLTLLVSGLAQPAGAISRDPDGDRLPSSFEKERTGTNPRKADTDGDGIPDGLDTIGQDRLRSGILKAKGSIKFGGTPGEDRLKLKLDVGTGATEFDPATRAITLTVSDDDEIYTVTIPAGTLVPNASGKTFKFKDKLGTNNGLTSASFKKGKPGQVSKLSFRTGDHDLSNADQNDHVLSIVVNFGAQTVTGSANFTFKGTVGKILGPP